MTFHANYLMRRQFAWNVKSYFTVKTKKIFQMSSASIQSVLFNISRNVGKYTFWHVRPNQPAYSQSDQIIHCPYETITSLTIQNVPSEDSGQTAQSNLNLRRAHMSESTFSDIAALMYSLRVMVFTFQRRAIQCVQHYCTSEPNIT